MHSVNNKKAMTLLELLIVLSITLLIMAMIIPSFHILTKRTRRAICLNNLRVLDSASQSYCIEEKVSNLTEISQSDLISTNYLTAKLKCPEGDVEYKSFVIRDGPVCPNISNFPDHKLGGN